MKQILHKSTFLFLCFSIFFSTSIFGQWSKGKRNKSNTRNDALTAKIIDNNPKNAENLHFLLSPFYWNAQNALDLNVRLETYYRKDNKWSIGGFIAKSYLFEDSQIDQNAASAEGIKKPLRIGVTGDYFFHDKKKKREYKIVVKSENTGYREITHYYVPANGYQYHFVGARGGYTLFNGTAAASFQPAPEAIFLDGALPNVTEGTLHLGISRMKIFRMKAEVDGVSHNDQKLIRYLYLDVLLNTNTSYRDDLINSSGDAVNIDDWETVPVGLRFGYKRFPSRKFDYHFTIEFGIKPGTVHNTTESSNFLNNSFINIGFGYGFGTKI